MAVALTAQTFLGPAAHADGPPKSTQHAVTAGDLRITTDRREYQVGDRIQICFTLPAPGWYAIEDWQEGVPHRLREGFNYDGHCFWGLVTPPVGYEYLQLKYRDQHTGQFHQVWSAAFQVEGAVPN